MQQLKPLLSELAAVIHPLNNAVFYESHYVLLLAYMVKVSEVSANCF